MSRFCKLIVPVFLETMRKLDDGLVTTHVSPQGALWLGGLKSACCMVGVSCVLEGGREFGAGGPVGVATGVAGSDNMIALLSDCCVLLAVVRGGSGIVCVSVGGVVGLTKAHMVCCCGVFECR